MSIGLSKVALTLPKGCTDTIDKQCKLSQDHHFNIVLDQSTFILSTNSKNAYKAWNILRSLNEWALKPYRNGCGGPGMLDVLDAQS
jgi:hypothetical protein